MGSQINIPHDIVVQILYRLEAKDVLRLRCVSKDYRDFIDNPDFPKLHLSHSLKTNSCQRILITGHRKDGGKYYNYALDLDSLENYGQIKSSDILPGLQEQVKFQIIGSSNGLIAFENINGDGFVICNPTTGEIRKVGSPRYYKYHEYNPDLVNYGFGYDPVSDDYKLVVIKIPGHLTYLYIYSLKGGRWTSCSFREPRCDRHLCSTNAQIVAFDLTSHRYRDVPLPLLFCGDIYELGGCLCMIRRCSLMVIYWYPWHFPGVDLKLCSGS